MAPPSQCCLRVVRPLIYCPINASVICETWHPLWQIYELVTGWRCGSGIWSARAVTGTDLVLKFAYLAVGAG